MFDTSEDTSIAREPSQKLARLEVVMRKRYGRGGSLRVGSFPSLIIIKSMLGCLGCNRQFEYVLAFVHSLLEHKYIHLPTSSFLRVTYFLRF